MKLTLHKLTMEEICGAGDDIGDQLRKAMRGRGQGREGGGEPKIEGRRAEQREGEGTEQGRREGIGLWLLHYCAPLPKALIPIISTDDALQ